MRGKGNNFYLSELRCTECGAIMPIQRPSARKREKEHIKDLWCYRCGKVTKFIENSDAANANKHPFD